jgi:2-phospho-L-lactate guanylyltransferase
MSRAGAVVPIRSFAEAKLRLAAHLSEQRRVELAREFATRVVEAAAPMPVVVVSSAPEVVEWARGLRLDVVADPGSGLDGAAAAGRSRVGELGLTRVVVVHADLPFAESIVPLARDGALPIVTLVPCHREDGTNVCSLPVDLPFQFAYGPGSFRRHVDEAARVGAEVRIVRRPDLAFDVDLPADLERLGLTDVAAGRSPA